MPEPNRSVIRVVWGTGVGATAVSSYDSALAAAGVHNYNLLPVSSVIPADTPVVEADTAPDLGPHGNILFVVQSRATTDRNRATAGLGWILEDGFGVFYEAHGELDVTTVRSRIIAGLSDARELRDWPAGDNEMKIVTARSDDEFVTAVVLGIYGESRAIMERTGRME